jgi:hypothetical protein
MDAGFLMHGDPIDASLGKRRDELVGAFDHQMAIERDAADFAQRGDHWGSNCQIGDEVTIHDVDVEKGSSAVNCGLRVCAEPCEVSRENRRSEFDHRDI